MLIKSMLTQQTLNRFEHEFFVDRLSDDEQRKIENNAYCANMGANSSDDAWDWFMHLNFDVDHLIITKKPIEGGTDDR